MFCCTNCFNNKYIIEYIESEGEHDNCNYCMSCDVPVIDIADWESLFVSAFQRHM